MNCQTIHRLSPKKIDSDADMLLAAKRLHATVYLKRNFISVDEVDEDGKIHLRSDPHQVHSDYFVITDHNGTNQIVATARQIRTLEGHHDLPILQKARISKKQRSNLLKLPHTQMIEISGLAKASGVPSAAVIELYRAMWLYSNKHGHALWLMACDVRLYKKLKILFGKSIRRIGRRTHYKGGDIIPCVLDLSVAKTILENNHNSKHLVYKNVRKKVASYFLVD